MNYSSSFLRPKTKINPIIEAMGRAIAGNSGNPITFIFTSMIIAYCQQSFHIYLLQSPAASSNELILM